MPTILLLNKPFRTLTQFTDTEGRDTLARYIDTQRYPGYYAAGRLDYDSEGLVALTNDGSLQHQLANPKFKLPKTYWVQVEGAPSDSAIKALTGGLLLKDGTTKPCRARAIAPPQIWEREPPIRQRANTPTHWLEITLTEGKNRQVRRMTAAVGLPTLRLIRTQIGHWQLNALAPGQYREEFVHVAKPAATEKRTRVRSKRPTP
ncbi:MAG TPA: pseudouridine synthase [Marinagarivorans sp.]